MANIDKQITENTVYGIRETGTSHSAFQLEYQLFCAIRDGNISLVKKAIDKYMNAGLVVGNMSNNSTSAARYWAVSSISTAIHYAILGGLDETEAYTLSDSYIRHIDTLSNMEQCFDYLSENAIELTKHVANSKFTAQYPPHVTAVLHYVHIHLHERLRIEDVANALGLSRDYLSHLFKKSVGVSLHQYILEEKLKEAKTLLIQGNSIDQISYTLCFSSESHFIQCFRKYYGVTPRCFSIHSAEKSTRSF